MIDPEVEYRIKMLKELMPIWLRFYKILSVAFHPEDITPEHEESFQEIKLIVAERHEAFMKIITHDFHIGQSILLLVKRTISLNEFIQLSPVEINKMSIEWHDANILLNETLGTLEHRQQELAAINASQYKAEQAKKKFIKTVRNFLSSQLFKYLVISIVMGVVGFVIYLNWDFISTHPKIEPHLTPLLEKLSKFRK